MFQEHKYLIPPVDENAKIWRIMDISKFLTILEYSSLYFTRADKFEDPFEGQFSQNFEINFKPYTGSPITHNLLNQFHDHALKYRSHTYLNCWHLNIYESAAMWSLYLSSNEGIAIQSTYKRLCDSLIQEKPDVYVGIVNYIDYESEWVPDGNSLLPFMHKRLSFAHENELRAIIQDPPIANNIIDIENPKFDHGFYFKSDITKLIERIYISPLSKDWIYDIIRAILKRYELEVPIIKSNLYEMPK